MNVKAQSQLKLKRLVVFWVVAVAVTAFSSFAFSAANESKSSPTCRRALAKSEQPSYDHPSYLAYKALLDSRTLSVEDGRPLSDAPAFREVQLDPARAPVELLIAVIEKVDRFSLRGKRTVLDVLQNGSPKEKRSLTDLLEAFNSSTDLYEGEVQRLLTDCYLIVHPTALRFINRFRYSLAARDKLRRHIETSLMSKDFMQAMEDLGFPPGNDAFSGLNDYLRRNSFWYKLPLSTAANYVSISSSLIGFPVSFPTLDLTRWSAIPTDILEAVRKDGFAASEDLIMKRYALRSKTDYVYSLIRQAFLTSMSVMTIHLAVHMAPIAATLVQTALISETSLIAYQEGHQTPTMAREEQLQSYIDFIRISQKREPSSEEIAQKRATLAALPDQVFMLR